MLRFFSNISPLSTCFIFSHRLQREIEWKENVVAIARQGNSVLLGREGGSSVSCALVWPKGGCRACASPGCSAEQHMNALECAVKMS